MSVEATKAVIERMKTDKDFAAKVSQCKRAEDIEKYLLANGYEVTYEDLKVLISEEISDDELDRVAGGSISVCGDLSRTLDLLASFDQLLSQRIKNTGSNNTR